MQYSIGSVHFLSIDFYIDFHSISRFFSLCFSLSLSLPNDIHIIIIHMKKSRLQIQMICSSVSNKRQHKVSLLNFDFSFDLTLYLFFVNANHEIHGNFFSFRCASMMFGCDYFFLHFIFVSGVTAEYSNNELLFVYKNLIGNRNASSPIGIFEGRRNTMNAEQLRRSPISGDIPKWFHQLLMLRSDFLKTSRTFLNGIFTFHNTNHFIWGKNRAKTLKLYEFLYLNQFTRVE